MFLQKHAERGKFKVYIVDGVKARQLDKEITDWATSGSSKAVPKGQIWLDKLATDESEYPVMMEEAIAYQMARDRGMPHDKALALADKKAADERGARAKSGNKKLASNPAITRQVELKKIANSPDGGDIILVDGKKVRKLLDPDFTEGGHDLVYSFIPKSPGGRPRYWIDNQNMPEEMRYFIKHETTERPLMARGESYDKAHEEASKLEHEMRMGGK